MKDVYCLDLLNVINIVWELVIDNLYDVLVEGVFWLEKKYNVMFSVLLMKVILEFFLNWLFDF